MGTLQEELHVCVCVCVCVEAEVLEQTDGHILCPVCFFHRSCGFWYK